MKRFLSISLFIIYLFFSLGIVISLHYCSGNLAGINFFEKGSCCCDTEEIANDITSEDCCKDEFKTMRISDEQIATKAFAEISNYDILSSEIVIFKPNFAFQYQKKCFLKSSIPRPPDDLFLIPIYKKVHSFIFYS